MGRILFFVFVGLAAYVAYRWWRVQQLRDSRGPGAAPGASRAAAEPMVRCETCGLNLPQSEALTLPAAGGERWFCSEEHRRAAAPR